MPAATPYAVVERDANRQVWQRETYEMSPGGSIVTNVHKYTELASGLNYRDTSGNWQAAQELIESYPGGAVARQGQYQVIFAGDLNSCGAIDMQTPDGKRLRSNILGLMYVDTASGDSAMIATLQDSTGQLISSNQVLYPDAFAGVKADVRYTYRRGGFEQDVILREQPPKPAAYGFNPATTVLEVVTEFINPPAPSVAERSSGAPGEVDDTVNWGATKIGRGKAFDLTGRSSGLRSFAPVNKRYLNIQGRQFLIERVRLTDIQPQLTALPLQSSIRQATPKAASLAAVIPPAPPARTDARPIKLAATTPPDRGYVLDYVTISSSQTNFTFCGDMTYYVSGEYSLSGTTTIEGGAVIKMNGSGQVDIDQNGTLNCQTAPYRPAVFTSYNDNSVGERISGSSGTPATSDTFLFLYLGTTNTVIHDFSFRYGSISICDNWGYVPSCLNVRDCQFVRGECAVYGYNTSMRNVLIGSPARATLAIYTEGPNFSAENMTADTATNGTLIEQDHLPSANISLTNCIIIAGDLTIVYPANLLTNSTVWLKDTSNRIFQVVGGGSYYLADGSPYRNTGTTNIDPDLLADLAAKTTYPPVVYSNIVISTDTTLVPQAQRNTDAPDLGYHYTPIDYLVDGVTITNAVLTVSNGAALASYNESGIQLQNGSSINSVGTPEKPNWFTRFSSVQEQPVALGGTNLAWGLTVSAWHSSSAAPGGLYSFSKFACLAGCGMHFYDTLLYTADNTYSNLVVQNCEFYGGTCTFSGNTNTVTVLKNNLFDRSSVQGGVYLPQTYLSISNNLFYGGSLSLNNFHSPNLWRAFDNAFDSCAVYGTLTNGYNAYLNCSSRLSPGSAFDVVTSLAMAYQTGPLGLFYQPPNSLLVNAGSTTADQAGLYHFTTQTNQIKETNSVVDIGYHYVALDANGNPVDTDTDGIPDYVEDKNGNGVADAGETSFTNWDTDGDGLSDLEESKILVDANNPGLGYLDPLNPDTGNTGVPDGQKDSDHDGISNLGELRTYHSNPATAHTFNMVKNDAEYLFTAKLGDAGTTKATLGIAYLGGGLLGFQITGADANAVYDLYYVNNLAAQRWQWRRVYSGAQCDNIGTAAFELEEPDPSEGYFVALLASDSDGDGLSDGYEAWFNYNGLHTIMNVNDSDGDGMKDGWEVEYGLNPMSISGPDGKYGNPDGDAYPNGDEFSSYNVFDGSYDPLEAYNTSSDRPVVSVSANAMPSCEESSFTISRYAGVAADYSRSLSVYYSVGGTLSYDNGDYTLNPEPISWPRIYSATIPAGQQSVIVTVDAPGVSQNSGEDQTVNVALTPYAVAADPQVSDPLAWSYVVDYQNNHVAIDYENQNLRPHANDQTVQMCPTDPPIQISLAGYDNCGGNLSFSIVTEPQKGTLGIITPDPNDPNQAFVTYTRGACGLDSFTFKVNDGVRDSAPATVTIDVGDPNPTISPLNVTAMIGKNASSPINFDFTGSDVCGNALTFSAIPGLGPLNGALTINPIDASHATVGYQPNPDFEEKDGFDMIVNNCGFSCPSPAQVTVYVVGGPVLTVACNPFENEVGVELKWGLDAAVQHMENYEGLLIKDFKIYRSDQSGGPYTLIGTTSDGNQTAYWDNDPNLISGHTYYYVVTFEYQGTLQFYESPYSNETSATAQQSNDFVPSDAFWDVTDITDPNNPIYLGTLQAPFSNWYPNQYENLFPLPNADWPIVTARSNNIVVNLPTGTDLSQVKYSIAIDNQYWLYVNGSSAPIDTDDNHDVPAVWHAFKSFEGVSPGILHYGNNNISVVIRDYEAENYFSMVIITNNCDGP